MKSANPGRKVQLWGDTSAFSLSTRIPIVQQVLEMFPSKWLVNGSDFPIPIEGWIHLPWVTHGSNPRRVYGDQEDEEPSGQGCENKESSRVFGLYP